MPAEVGRLETPPEVMPATQARGGSNSYILHSRELEGWLTRQFGVGGLCLKVFPGLTSPDGCWEFVPLRETAVVQNLFAAEGWATRVHALVSLAEGSMAEVTEYAQRLDQLPPDRAALAPFWALVDRYGIGTRSRVCPGGALKWDFILDTAAGNWSEGRLLDWGGKYRRRLYPEWDEEQPSREEW